MADVFNNPSNDYIYPALSPCAGASDDSYLQVGNGVIEIVSGTKILAGIDFSDLKIPVSAYSTQTQILSEGEVTYIPGLTKGLQKKNQGFTMPYLTTTDESLNPYFFTLDLSINYYKNFKYSYANIDVSSNYSNNVNIEDALNIALGAKGINVTAAYDPSILSFAGTIDGYEFNVSNVVLGIIDASQDSYSPFAQFANASTYELEEDPSAFIPYAKYPNGAMQGIIMRGIYPSTTPMTPYDKWLYINHTSDYATIYDPIEIDNFISNIRREVSIYYDPSISFGPFIPDASVNPPDFICDGSWAYEPSTSAGTLTSTTILQTSVSEYLIQECSILQSEIYYSKIKTNASNSDIISDSSIYGSDIYPIVSGLSLQELLNLFMSDSSISEMFFINSFIQSSWIRDSYATDVSLACIQLFDSSISDSDIAYSMISGGELRGANILSSSLIDVSVYDSSSGSTIIKDSSIITSEISGLLESCDVSASYIHNSYSKDSYIYQTTIIDSSIKGEAVDGSSFVYNSTLENVFTNAYKLIINPSLGLYQWVIDDPTLSIDDPSMMVQVQFSTINDSSLNNITVKDSSIYTSYLQDASLIRCTLYNVSIDPSSVTLEDCRNIQINMTQDCSVVWDVDSSIFYTKSIKSIDVGMNGCSTTTVMSAGDYLEWITTNDYWNKFGDLYIWISAPDGCSSCENLINGFYVFNPHTFDVKIEYMLFV